MVCLLGELEVNFLQRSYKVNFHHLQRKDVVRNQICFLMVQARDENPSSMDDFFTINASEYGNTLSC